jgi:predicted nucleotidyltransferase
MNERSNILSYLETNKERLMREYHLTKIGLFGSFSREDNNQASDIDLVVEFEPETQDLYLLKQNLRQEIQLIFNRPVDICRLKYIKPIFRSQIQQEVQYV